MSIKGYAEQPFDQNGHLYPFIFTESTGDNRFLLFDKKLHPLKAFSLKSNRDAVVALNALNANILYVNGDGTKIFLFGEYHEKDSTFSLTAWFILSPFMSNDIIDEKELPQRFLLNRRTTLVASDFSKSISSPSDFVATFTQPLSELIARQKRRSKP